MTLDKSTPAAVRANNLSLTLNLIREQGSITRTELVERTNLSGPTISALVNLLISYDFVREAGPAASSGGRRPISLEFNPNARFVMGIDMGGAHATVLLINLNGQVHEKSTRKLEVIRQPAESMEQIQSMIFEVIHRSGVHPEDILGIGYTVPVPLRSGGSEPFLTRFMPAWKGLHPVQDISRKFRLPVTLENDANAGAIAEKWWGLGRGVDCLAYIKIGTGVGGGLILDHEIYRGFSGSAGEIGHTTIEANGRLCRCGNHGCLESYIGLPGLLADACEQLSRDPAWTAALDGLTIEQVIREARNGQPTCRRVITRAGEYLGIGLSNLVSIINPRLIILGGDLIEAGDLLLDAATESMRKHMIPFEQPSEKVVLSELGQDAVAIGAATMVLIQAFSAQKLYETLRRREKLEIVKEVVYQAH